MNLLNEILKEHSKPQTQKIIDWIGDSQERFDELLNLILHDEKAIAQRASWAMSYCVIAYPQLIKNHFAKLIKNLKREDIHDAVKRNTVRLLAEVDIPRKHHGEIMNICFEYISSPKEPAAVKAFSLTVLENLSKIYPDIKKELELIIIERWPFETGAFHSRGRKILKNLQSTSPYSVCEKKK
jgi:hypothetical protein